MKAGNKFNSKINLCKANHYIIELCGGSKVKAAAMLGYKNYQNLSNEMKRLEI